MWAFTREAEAHPVLSIVIPTFQEESYIGATISNLRRMGSSTCFEVIVVDGGSTDNTVKEAQGLADRVCIINKRGISTARNFGARRARSELLLFLDADVNPPAGFVEKILHVFEDRNIIGATCTIMPKYSRALEKAFFYFYNGLIRFVCGFRPHSRGEFLAVRKSVFLSLNGFDEALPCLEDHDLAYRLSKMGKFAFVKDFTVYESMRRFRKLGFSKTVGTWIIDYLFFLFRGKPLSIIWKPVR